jgi:hypothetical protein
MSSLVSQIIALSGGAALLHDARPLLAPPMLGAFEIGEHVIGLAALVASLVFAAVVFVVVLHFQSKKRQMWHETARLALEKGQPLPPWPKTDEELELTPPPGVSLAEWEALRRARDRRGSLKAGLILIAVGVGLYFMMPGPDLQVGAIPGLIGVALIVHALIERLTAGGLPPSPRKS